MVRVSIEPIDPAESAAVGTRRVNGVQLRRELGVTTDDSPYSASAA